MNFQVVQLFTVFYLLHGHSLISRAWEVAGTKYDDPKLAKENASNILRDYEFMMELVG